MRSASSIEAVQYLDVGVGGSGATVIEASRRGVVAVGCDLSIEGVSAAARAAQQEDVGTKRFFACVPPKHSLSRWVIRFCKCCRGS